MVKLENIEDIEVPIRNNVISTYRYLMDNKLSLKYEGNYYTIGKSLINEDLMHVSSTIGCEGSCNKLNETFKNRKIKEGTKFIVISTKSLNSFIDIITFVGYQSDSVGTILYSTNSGKKSETYKPVTRLNFKDSKGKPFRRGKYFTLRKKR